VLEFLLDTLTEPGWSALPLGVIPIALATSVRKRYRTQVSAGWVRLPLFRVVILWPFAAGGMAFCAILFSAWNQVGYFSTPWLSGRPEGVVPRLILQVLVTALHLRAQYEIYLLALATLSSSFGDVAAAAAADSMNSSYPRWRSRSNIMLP